MLMNNSHTLSILILLVLYIYDVDECTGYVPSNSKRLDVTTCNIQGNIFRIDCKMCNHFLALRENNDIVDIDETFDENNKNCWKEVKTNRERIIYYILNQIIYPEFDTPKAEKFESLYGYADHFDKIILKWEKGKAIGFYTVKPKESEIFSTRERYAMPTLDTAYIRSQYRNRGFGVEILLDIIERFPNEDIGFSKPISEGMWRVLRKFLTKHKEYRMRFWEIENAGNEGSRKLIWFLLRKRASKNNKE